MSIQLPPYNRAAEEAAATQRRTENQAGHRRSAQALESLHDREHRCCTRRGRAKTTSAAISCRYLDSSSARKASSELLHHAFPRFRLNGAQAIAAFACRVPHG